MKRLWAKGALGVERSERRKFWLFAACLIFAICFWVLFSLSKTYTYTAQALVRFKNLPLRKGFELAPFRALSLKLEGTGWSLLNSSHRPSSLVLEADLAGSRKKNFINLKEFIPEFNQQMQGEKIVEVEPDTIRYGIFHRSSKKVPLVYHYDISFARQYYFLDPVLPSPDSVLLTGPPGALRKITRWDTPSLLFRGLDHSVDTMLYLNDHRRPDLSVEPSSVHFSVRVDQFTEKIISLPVRAIHAGSRQEISLIPARVNVYLLVPLRYYGSLRPGQFDLVCDMDEWRNGRHSKLALSLKSAPDFVRLEKISPPDIDFLVRQ